MVECQCQCQWLVRYVDEERDGPQRARLLWFEDENRDNKLLTRQLDRMDQRLSYVRYDIRKKA